MNSVQETLARLEKRGVNFTSLEHLLAFSPGYLRRLAHGKATTRATESLLFLIERLPESTEILRGLPAEKSRHERSKDLLADIADELTLAGPWCVSAAFATAHYLQEPPSLRAALQLLCAPSCADAFPRFRQRGVTVSIASDEILTVHKEDASLSLRFTERQPEASAPARASAADFEFGTYPIIPLAWHMTSLLMARRTAESTLALFARFPDVANDCRKTLHALRPTCPENVLIAEERLQEITA